MTRPKSPPQAAEWWSLLDQQWQTIFKEAIGIESEPTADELVTILRLTKLDCHSKELTSLEPLRALTGLQTLNCGGNPRTSLEPLRACTGLQSLNCSDNQLTSLEPLQALSGLRTLNCSWNQLTDLEPLHGLKSLKQLDCRNNPSLSQSEIEHFHKAVLSRKEVNWLWWSSLNQQWQTIFKEAIGIESEPTAEELVTILSLTKLDCHSKKLTNLEPLRALTGLQTLNCQQNQLTSLEPLQACPGLQTLNCRQNQLTSLESLRALTGLQTLACGGNQLTSLEPLHGLSLKTLIYENNPSLSQPELERFLTNNKRCWWTSLGWQWQAIFREAIGIKSEPTETELVAILSLTELDCHGKELTNLEPLRALMGLQSLNCENNQLTSLEPLRACTGLQTLYCHRNQLTSLEPLQACPGLQTLNCWRNQLTSLEPLLALTGLQDLDCSENQLTSLEPLQALTGLQTLDCGGNQLTSLEPLHGLSLKTLVYENNPSLSQPELERFLTNNKRCWWTSLGWQWQAIFREAIGIKSKPTEKELETILSLTQLDCHGKKLTNLEPLRALMGLQSLNCENNQLTSLESLRACPGLQTLNCGANQLTSLEPLQALTGLQTLDCSHNRLTSLESLRACPGLQTLNCSWNQLTSLEPLRACPGLQNLHCEKNQLTSLEGLQALMGLQTLNCSSNQLTNLEPLRALTGLQTLNCSYNQLTNLEPLRALTGLQTLNCSFNQLTSLEPLQACTGLRLLWCSRNQLTSLEPLRVLTGLQSLHCASNQLTSLEPLRVLTGLQTLSCWGNQLTSLEPLQALSGLQRLELKIKSLTKLNPSLLSQWFWWSSLDPQWVAIFKATIGIKSEPTETELLTILSLTELKCDRRNLTSLEPLRALTGLQFVNCRDNRLTSLEPLRVCLGLQTLYCDDNQLTSLEPLRALTGLQTLDCHNNKLTSLEPLHGLKGLKDLDCKWIPSLSVQEIERFEKAMPSCRIFPTANDLRDIEREKIEAANDLRDIEREKIREKIEATKLKEQRVTAELGIDKIVPANNHFSFRLFDQLLQQDLGQNVFMSPLSVAIALAMTYNGAAGPTQTAMAKTLGLENLTLEEVNQANLALRNVLLHQSNPDMSLLIANSLWLNQDFGLEPAFLMRTQQFYAANVTNADFQSPATVSDINQWVKENTQGKIGPVVQHLDPLTVLLVINAIYFKGMWVKPFDRYYTRERDFTLLSGENKRIPMMSKTDYYSYYEGNNYQAVRLPYKASSLSMTIFLPSRGIPLESFPLRDHWQEWRAGNTSREGTLVLPRFKVEYEVTLNGALKALGMTEAFLVEDADFSQMAKVPTAGWNIYISQVKHKTFVEVNEEGTEAAAVTYEYLSGCAANPIPPFKMIVDHPFLFTIQDEGTGTVLFLGAIVEPK